MPLRRASSIKTARKSIPRLNAPPRVSDAAPRATSCSFRADAARTVAERVNCKVKQSDKSECPGPARVMLFCSASNVGSSTIPSLRNDPPLVDQRTTATQLDTTPKADDWVELATLEEPTPRETANARSTQSYAHRAAPTLPVTNTLLSEGSGSSSPPRCFVRRQGDPELPTSEAPHDRRAGGAPANSSRPSKTAEHLSKFLDCFGDGTNGQERARARGVRRAALRAHPSF